jgi:diguanylate cyclase (GGDEF)-like protein/hemerythrin-like metal-binding protein
MLHIQDIAEKDVNRLIMPHENTPSPAPGQCATPEHCTTRLELFQRVSELENRVSTDALTGLWNRAHFDHVIEKELDRSLRHKQPLSLILFDIDHFKRINDEFGHQAGDKVLREIALLGNAAIRSSDALFRWGGEEFAVLAPSTGHRGAVQLAESLRGGVASHRFPVVGSLTVSLGVAEHADSESADSWFRRADGMLYAAKRNGRNAVHADARGNSDLWAVSHGRAALHLIWQEAYECGEPAIDGEHRVLFRLANELIDAFLAGEEKSDGVVSACDRLLAHIALHFANEEALLAQRGFAGLDAHRRAHAGLLARARDLRNTVAAGGAGLGGMIEFLAGDVVARHLFKTDRDFFPLFSAGTGLPASRNG